MCLGLGFEVWGLGPGFGDEIVLCCLVGCVLVDKAHRLKNDEAALYKGAAGAACVWDSGFGMQGLGCVVPGGLCAGEGSPLPEEQRVGLVHGAAGEAAGCSWWAACPQSRQQTCLGPAGVEASCVVLVHLEVL